MMAAKIFQLITIWNHLAIVIAKINSAAQNADLAILAKAFITEKTENEIIAWSVASPATDNT